ncbi:MAG TPA: hypothetical protein VK285_07395 [Gaiellaceae bacterium]|nr:hypothetical protein [Gaiellaceae bacterium]
MLHSSYESVESDSPVVPDLKAVMTLCTAEVAECTCPEWCERDHDLD